MRYMPFNRQSKIWTKARVPLSLDIYSGRPFAYCMRQ